MVEATALAQIQTNKKLEYCFITVAKTMEAVIACRISPSQKADFCRMVKKNDPSKTTLSIGDGANDVSMILEADIGIGIVGKEGLRASQNSDFAVHEFKSLWNLVFFHGRLNYIRIADFILYFFYKNFIFTIPQFYFAFHSLYSGATVFEDYYITFYNMIFTALPITAKAIFECDLNYKNTSIDQA